MSYRKWTFGDLNQIESLEKECIPYAPWNLRMLADSFLKESFFGYLDEEEGQIVAYGGMDCVLDEAELLLIATNEMYRRCGRGSKILSLLTEEAKNRGVKRIFLEVRVSNAEAMALYLKNGFKGAYCRPRYYPDGEDALVMRLEL